jgi:hypothetical protein
MWGWLSRRGWFRALLGLAAGAAARPSAAGAACPPAREYFVSESTTSHYDAEGRLLRTDPPRRRPAVREWTFDERGRFRSLRERFLDEA